jgi:hypothetical protein
MDDPLDYLDLLDFVSGAIDAGNLDSGSIDALAGLLEKLDYTSFDADIAHAVADIDPGDTSFWADPGAGIFTDIDSAEWGDFAAEDEALFADASPLASDEFIDVGGDLNDFADLATDVDPPAVQASLDTALQSYPPTFTEGLTADDIHYDPLKNTESPKILAQYTPQLNPDGTVAGRIELFDHAESAVETFHHEIGHHIARINPTFFDEAINAMGHESDFVEGQRDFLSNYSSSKHGEELFAQANESYQTQPEILLEDAPLLYGVIEKHYAAASVA